MSEEIPQLEVETQEAAPEEPQVYTPDNTPIEAGPLKGLPAWVQDLKILFLGYGQQISQLTAIKQEMESVFGEIASTIILSLPEEIRPDESPVECTIRLLKDYAQLKDQLEPMSLRLAAAEKELELIKGKGDGAPAKTE